MRFIPTLALVVLLIPTALNAGLKKNYRVRQDDLTVCSERWSLVQDGIRERDFATLRGMLLPGGIWIASPDGTVSRKSLEQAALVWNEALGASTVHLAAAGQTPTVTVRKVNGIGKAKDLQGLIEVDESDNGLYSAHVLVDARYGSHPLTDREVGAVITHELGHFLGLNDIPLGTGVMGEFDPTHVIVRPSIQEASAVLALQRTVRQTVAELQHS